MSGKGSVYLIDYASGKKITPRQSILAKCAECTCDYKDGREDCWMVKCPLYPFMPYSSTPREKKKVAPRKAEGTNTRQKDFISRK